VRTTRVPREIPDLRLRVGEIARRDIDDIPLTGMLGDACKQLFKHKDGETWADCVSRKKQFLPELLHRLKTNGHTK